jgi:hypothetical protein
MDDPLTFLLTCEVPEALPLVTPPWQLPSASDLPQVPVEVDSAVALEPSRTPTLADPQTGILPLVVDPPREVVSAVADEALNESPMDSVRGRTENTSLVTGT